MDEDRGLREHFCHALECEVSIDPRLLMCYGHWGLVPKSLKQQVYRTYRKGQEIDKGPSPEYIRAARAAIVAVEQAQGARVPWWVDQGWEEEVVASG